MLLFDLSGIVVKSCINLHHDSREEVDINMVRHVAISGLLHYKKKFSKSYGTPVICVDRKPYWREAIHPYYKKNRKRSRDASSIDWKAFGENFDEVQNDIRDYLPYPFIDVPRAEADDSLSVLTQYACARKDTVMVVSSDKDMLQLQDKYSGVKQFSPGAGKLLTKSDNDYDLLTHIIKGDASDGIPNIFSPDDILMEAGGERQKSVTKKMLDEARTFSDPLDWCGDSEIKRRFKRNRLLIDTSLIPDRIQDKIISVYESETATKKPNRMREYAIQHRLRNLIQFSQDF